MAYSLVGSIGGGTLGAVGASVTPAWGSGQNRTAGNLLILWLTLNGASQTPTSPTGWNVAKQQAGTSTGSMICYRIATGLDSAPTITGVSGAQISAQLCEFTNATASPWDTGGAAQSTTTSVTAVSLAADVGNNELIIMVGSDARSAATAVAESWTFNNGTITTGANNNGSSATSHYSHVYCLSGGSTTTADNAKMTPNNTTNLLGLTACVASFKPIAGTNWTRYAVLSDPSKIAGAKAWWKADSLGLADGALVSSWTDQISSQAWSQGTPANQPTYKASIVNGLPVVRFYLNNTTLSHMDGPTMNVAQPNTIVLVTDQTNKAAPMSQVVDCVGSPRTLMGYNSSGFFSMYAGTTSLADATDHSAAFHCLVGCFDGASSFGFVDDAQVVSGNPGTQGIGAFKLGYDGNAANSFGGDVAEILVYNRHLTDAERSGVEAYCNRRYNLGITFSTPPGEALVLSESATRTIVRNRTATDSPSTSEAANEDSIEVRGATDNPTISESAVASNVPGGQAWTRTATESLSTSEGYPVTALISYWKLDETSGSRADSYGANTLVDGLSNTGSATGKIGNAASFVSANGTYLGHATNSGLTPGNSDYTFAMWVYPTDLTSGSVGKVIIGKDDGSNRDYMLRYNLASALFEFVAWTPTNNQFGALATTFGTPTINNWYFIVAWHDSVAQTLNICVNGGTVNSTSLGAALQGPGLAEFDVGRRMYSSSQLLWDGLIDEVGYWQRVLTSTEIATLYNSGAGLPFAPFATATIVHGGQSWTRTATESLATSEVATENIAAVRSAADAIATSESVTQTKLPIRSAVDSPATSESVVRTVVASRTATDAPHTSESAAGTTFHVLTRTAADAPVTSESVGRIGIFNRSATETLSTAELVTGSKFSVLSRTASESLSTSEVAGRILVTSRSATDAPHTVEVVVRSFTTSRTATDAPHTSESAARVVAAVRTATDALSTTETATFTRQSAGVYSRSATESLATSEALTVRFQGFRTAADAPSTSEFATGVRSSIPVTRTTTESLGIIQTVTRTLATTRFATDAPTTSDAGTRIGNFHFVAIESVSTNELVIGTKFSTVARLASESLGINQVAARQLIAGRTATDAPHTAESVGRRLILYRGITDALTTAEFAGVAGAEFVFIAGWITGSTLATTVADGNMTLDVAASTLQVIRTEAPAP